MTLSPLIDDVKVWGSHELLGATTPLGGYVRFVTPKLELGYVPVVNAQRVLKNNAEFAQYDFQIMPF
jgi:hypothetical protein